MKSRERVRDLAEVYTHKREVDAMLDLVAPMFPSEGDPANTDRTFLEPACGSGNFLEEILRRKLAFVSVARYGRGDRYEHRILRCVASIYGIDISQDNVDESRDRMRAVVNSHLDNDLNTKVVSDAFASAVEAILGTNIILGDTVADADRINLVEYRASHGCTFIRTWTTLDAASREMDLFAAMTPKCDARPVHFKELASHPEPVPALLNGVEA
ncbi:type III restriction endonuclease subunit M [Conexibacter sp. W3-3-2]|nr:type III restriction endonuclease subunit M [Conexibacter sp. W3-3-2]